MSIEKQIGHIWIGPQSPPISWMASWQEHHPDWPYRLYDNEFMINYSFRNQHLINEYFRRGKYAGVADLMRYEILYDFGGFLPEADSICLKATDPLFDGVDMFTVYESEKHRPGNVSPILASTKGHPFLKLIIDDLGNLAPDKLKSPFMATGNAYLKKMIDRHKPDIKVYPSRTFIPNHYSDETLPSSADLEQEGVYAKQMWGTTTKAYAVPTHHASLQDAKKRIHSALLRRSGNTVTNVKNRSYKDVENDENWKAELRNLNLSLIESLKQADLPRQLNGSLFYRHMQNSPIVDGKLATRFFHKRERLFKIAQQAKVLLEIGVNGGHSLFLAKSSNPQLHCIGVDICKRADKIWGHVEVYVPAAMKWLKRRFPGDFDFFEGESLAILPELSRSKDIPKIDLLHLSGERKNYAKEYSLAKPLLTQDAVIIFNDSEIPIVQKQVTTLIASGEIEIDERFCDGDSVFKGQAVMKLRQSD